jgi:hypothetical protein
MLLVGVESVWKETASGRERKKTGSLSPPPTTISLDMVQYLVRLLLMAARLGG